MDQDSAPAENEPPTEDPANSNESGETSTAEDEPAYEMFGDIVWPCNPGSATGATDQGVTDTSILIGGGDDRGYAASLGLNITQTDTLKAFVEKCNELGGINGREVLVELYDAKIFEVSNVWLDACPRMFMMVGKDLQSTLWEETRVQCELAHIPTYTVSAAAARGPMMIQPVPNPSDRNPYQWLPTLPRHILKQ